MKDMAVQQQMVSVMKAFIALVVRGLNVLEI